MAAITASALAQTAMNCASRRTLAGGKCEQRAACGDGDVLLPVDRVRHWARVDLSAERDLPEQVAVSRVEREQVAFLAASEEHVRRRRHHAGPRDVVHLVFPFPREAVRIERTDEAEAFLLFLVVRRQRGLAHRRAVGNAGGAWKFAFDGDGP